MCSSFGICALASPFEAIEFGIRNKVILIVIYRMAGLSCVSVSVPDGKRVFCVVRMETEYHYLLDGTRSKTPTLSIKPLRKLLRVRCKFEHSLFYSGPSNS